MSSLDFKIEDPTDDTMGKNFHILRDFLQPNTAMTLETSAQLILDLLPEEAPLSNAVWAFGEVCIELAEQIPYYHPSQLKLAGLLEYLGESTKFGLTHLSKETNTSQYFRYQRLGESLRDSLNDPDPENLSHHINFHAFAANLWERRILATSPTWAIWAQRDAHETRLLEEPGSIHIVRVLAAAQWILWYGQTFFKHVLYPGDVSSRDLQHWQPGPLYNGSAHLTLQRWHFWRDGFNSVASNEKEEDSGFSQECKSLAAKAAEMMDCLEKNMTF